MGYLAFAVAVCPEDASIHAIAAMCADLDIGLGDILRLGDHVSSAKLAQDLEGIAAAGTAAADRVYMRKVIAGPFIGHR